MVSEVTEMSVPAADDAHEFVVAPELAEVAERLGVPLHAGDRIRFEVIHGGADEDIPPRRPSATNTTPPVPRRPPVSPRRQFQFPAADIRAS